MFDYFIVLAEMRTGSNFLETNLNALDGVQCHGEAFNPHFIGYPNRADLLGLTQDARDRDPAQLVEAVKAAPGLNGFRFFHNHDPRVLELALADRRCAKIILTRNPLDSYVSLKIAKATNQWKLTNVQRRKDSLAEFDALEFAEHVTKLQAFQVEVLHRMQTSGQTAFYVAYEDLQDIDVMNGLAAWLGSESRLESLDQSLKVQNPGSVTEKVSNPEEMEQALAGLDRFNLTRTPNFEPRRGASVPSYIGGVTAPLLFLPVPGGPVDTLRDWLAALDGVSADDLHVRMNQKQLRQWKRKRTGHRSFSVLRHPLARAHEVFCRRIVATGPGSYDKIRDTLRRQFKLPLPEGAPDASYGADQHRDAFHGFLEFVRANLAGQTAIRVDAAWATQATIVSSFADFILPDHILREDELDEALGALASKAGYPQALASKAGYPQAPAPKAEAETGPHTLKSIHDKDLEDLAADVYQRDYVMFGFGPWRA